MVLGTLNMAGNTVASSTTTLFYHRTWALLLASASLLVPELTPLVLPSKTLMPFIAVHAQLVAQYTNLKLGHNSYSTIYSVLDKLVNYLVIFEKLSWQLPELASPNLATSVHDLRLASQNCFLPELATSRTITVFAVAFHTHLGVSHPDDTGFSALTSCQTLPLMVGHS